MPVFDLKKGVSTMHEAALLVSETFSAAQG
jgi:hypothetical protein